MKKYTRECSDCKRTITYKVKYAFVKAQKENTKCRKCGTSRSAATRRLKFVIGQKIKDFTVLNAAPKYIGKNNTLHYFVRCKCDKEYWIRSIYLNYKNSYFSCIDCINKKRSGKDNGSYKGYEDIPCKNISAIKYRAKHRNDEYNISDKDLWDLYVAQDKKCALSGVNLIFGNSKIETTASLDRIDNAKGYIKNNIQWVHKDINRMKERFNQNIFINHCINVAKTQTKKRKNK